MQAQKILITGGAGYIGSHTVIELIKAGHEVVIVDNLVNASAKVLPRLEELTGTKIPFYEADTRDKQALREIFAAENIGAVIHFAGLKAVGESVAKPLEYYNNNLVGLIHLAEVMAENNCFNLVFSSSACVYGDPEVVPITEEQKTGAVTNPYGWTKWMIEQMLQDLTVADERWNIVILRYFNPVGAHESGLIGEDPRGIPNNLLPYVAQVAVGRQEAVRVFGNDYPTPDGTGVRDYIHVVDLAAGHVAALNWMAGRHGAEVFNLGTGRGNSVLEVVAAFSAACGKELPIKILPRRAGDAATSYCDPRKAKEMLGWEAQYDLAKACVDSWKWQSQNPQGFAG